MCKAEIVIITLPRQRVKYHYRFCFILRLAGDGGAPFVGALGSAFLIGSKLLTHGPTSQIDPSTQIKDGTDNKDDHIRILIQDGYNEILSKLEVVLSEIEDLRKTAQKTLGLIAEMKWKDGLKRFFLSCIRQNGNIS